MNPISRVMRYGTARLGLGGFSRRVDGCASDNLQLVRTTFEFAGGFLAPIQVEEEIVQLVEDVRKLAPKIVLEIGTSMGGTLFLWTRLAQDDALIISADLPGGKFGGGYSPLRTPIYEKFARPGQELHLLRVNSHDSGTLERVKELLGGRKIDFLFIDGDHTYEGVKQDWNMYHPLVRKGGLVAFHDIAMNYDDTQVKRFWDELKPNVRYREYACHPRGFYGIGVVEI